MLEDHPHMDPVKVDELEEGMTRKERRIVAQMRSGYCPLLNDYKARIDNSQTELCRKCQVETETVRHFQRCQLDEEIRTLWEDPKRITSKMNEMGL